MILIRSSISPQQPLMAQLHIARFIQPLRFTISLTSKSSSPAITFCEKFQTFKTWMNGLQSRALHFDASCSNWKLHFQKFLRLPNFGYSVAGMWSIVGGSLILGSVVSFWPGLAYSIDGFHLVDDHPRGVLTGTSDLKEDQHTFLAFAKQLMVALFLVANVLTDLGHLATLAAKLTFILLSSKPNPSSVYLFIEQWRCKYMSQYPLWYKFKPLYVKQVEVEDYTFLYVVRVEIQDEKFTLIGILGNWWVFELGPCLETFSVLGNKDQNKSIKN